MGPVEHEDPDAAAEGRLVRRGVARRRALDQRLLGALDRNRDLGERRDLLGDPFLENLEVIPGEGAEELSPLVHDERVDLDVVDLGPEDGIPGLPVSRRLLGQTASGELGGQREGETGRAHSSRPDRTDTRQGDGVRTGSLYPETEPEDLLARTMYHPATLAPQKPSHLLGTIRRAARLSAGVAFLLGSGGGCVTPPAPPDQGSQTGDRAAVGEDGAQRSARGIPLKTPLSRVPFLMAHDAATTYRHDYSLLGDVVAGQVQTQPEGGFTALLDCGVRAFDVRPCYTHERQLYMHHGPATIKRRLEDALREVIDWAGRHPEDLVLVYVSHCAGGVDCTGGTGSPEDHCDSVTAGLLLELGITMLPSVDISHGEAQRKGRLANGGLVVAFGQARENYDESIQYCAGKKVKASAFGDLFAYMDRIAVEPPPVGELVITQAHWQDPHTTFVDGCAETVLEMESASQLNRELIRKISGRPVASPQPARGRQCVRSGSGAESGSGEPRRAANLERVTSQGQVASGSTEDLRRLRIGVLPYVAFRTESRGGARSERTSVRQSPLVNRPVRWHRFLPCRTRSGSSAADSAIVPARSGASPSTRARPRWAPGLRPGFGSG